MKKQVKAKIIVLAAAFIIMSLFTFASLYYQETEPSVTTMNPATLPVVYMMTPGGYEVNPSCGYLSDINGASVFNGITPLDEKRNVKVMIYQYEEKVTALSYRVYDMENGKLLEDTDVAVEGNRQKKNFSVEFNIKNLIEKGQQYLLQINISTDNHEKISYYERILWEDDLNVDGKLAYVLQFHAYTYSAENLSEIEQWIETDGTGDNTNYGHVNIHSTSEQIGWGDLEPHVDGAVVPVILEISGTVAQVSLSYRVATPRTTQLYDSYEVNDFYRILQSGEDRFYLLSYDRRANQNFDGNEDLQASGRLNLGIKESQIECEAKSDEKGQYAYFVDSGQLWCYARTENKFTNVFSFRSVDDTGLRSFSSQHDIRLLSVDENGAADFLVYGYMARGEHEGETGVSLYRYDYEENEVSECIFIPLDLTYDEMQGKIGDVAYLSDDQFYIRIDTVLYSIDLVSREMMIMTEGLYDGTYAVNTDGTRLAYQYTHSLDDEEQIRILNLSDGTEKLLNVHDYGNKGEDDRLRLIGYIGDDIVFGICSRGDIEKADGVNQVFPMYGIYILDSGYELIKTYEEDGIYVVSASIDGMRVNLSRMVRNEEGFLVSTTIDQLMNRSENNAKSGMYTEVVTTKSRKKEIYLYLPSTAGNTESVSLRYSKAVVYDADGRFVLNTEENTTMCYYAYGYGRCLGVFDNLSDAVRSAADKEGMVLDTQGSCLWHRTQKMNTILWNEAYGNLGVSDFAQNLTGLSLDNILYFISDGKLVLARCGQDSFALLYDYDNTNIYYYDQETGKLLTKTRTEAEKLFIEWGNVFLTQEK